MIFTKEQKKSAYHKLPPEVQNFVLSNEVIESIENISQKNGLSAEQSDLLDSAVYEKLLGLKTKEELSSELITLLKSTPDKISEIIKDLESNIFSELQKIESSVNYKPNNNVAPAKKEIDFVEDAKGNSDNIAPSVIISSATRGSQQSEPQAAPQTTLEQKIENQSNPSLSAMVKKHYPGQDPYREPIN